MQDLVDTIFLLVNLMTQITISISKESPGLSQSIPWFTGGQEPILQGDHHKGLCF